MYLPTGDRGCDRFIGRLPGITNHGPVFLLLLGLKLGKGYGDEGEIEIVHGNLPLPVQASHMRILRRVQDQPLGMYPRQQLLRQFLTVVMVLFVPVFQAGPYLRRRLQPLSR